MTALRPIAAFAALALSSAAPAQDGGFVSEVVARYPSGSYLENLTVAPDGAVLFTNYFADAIQIWRSGAGARTFARLPVHPANIVRLGRGYLVLAHAAKFTDGPAALAGANRLLWLDGRGRVTRTLAVPGLVFGNGLVPSGRGAALVTDSVRGMILKVDLASGRATPWLEDPRLLPDPVRPRAPAANGLRRGDGVIYVTNSASRSVFRVPVDSADRPAGPLELVATAPGADDLAVARDGTLYVATHRQTVVRVRGGRVDAVVARDVAGCTSVALSADGRTLFVLGTGGLFEGAKDEATLVRAAVTP